MRIAKFAHALFMSRKCIKHEQEKLPQILEVEY